MGSLGRRLDRLEHLRLPTADRGWVTSLSDEELDARIEAFRAEMGEAEFQELIAEMKPWPQVPDLGSGHHFGKSVRYAGYFGLTELAGRRCSAN
jgi:hypothetical protein